MEENQNVDRGRIVDDYKHSIIQSVEHDENHPGTWSESEARDSQALREQYAERGKQLDENEAVAKEQYDNNHCEEVTGQTSDDYRRQVIEDYTHEQMADKQAETQGVDYWDSSSNDVSASTDSQNAVQSENADYWSADNASSSLSNEQSDEKDNSLSNETSC